jgi:hypothetical protein
MVSRENASFINNENSILAFSNLFEDVKSTYENCKRR